MTSLKQLVLIVFLLCLLAPGVAISGTVYKASPQVPLDSWTYPALEKVVALFRVDSGLASLKPLTRLEAARLTLKASLKEKLYYVPLQAKMLLRRLKKEFAEELAYLENQQNEPVKVEPKPVRSVTLSYVYRDGADTERRQR